MPAMAGTVARRASRVCRCRPRRESVRHRQGGLYSARMEENDVVVEAWNTVLFDKFLRFKHLLVAGLSGHSNEFLSRAPYRPGERVLDVGCGFGDCTIPIARQ